MTQTTTRHAREGWQPDEIDTLFNAVREASAIGRPLRDVFCDVGERLSRKPNSIRNFYYARVRETPRLAPAQPAFRAFDENELHTLLREVLMGRGRGESVRACVTRLAGGERAGMLRYQNKYRSILKNKPERLLKVCEELRAEGLPCPDDPLVGRKAAPARSNGSRAQDALMLLGARMDDPCVRRALEALCALIDRADAAAALADAKARETRDADAAANRSCDASGLDAMAGGETISADTPEQAEGYRQKWMEALREADRLRVEVDLLKMALEDARDGAPIE